MLRHAVNIFNLPFNNLARVSPVRFHPRLIRQPFKTNESNDFSIKDEDESYENDVFTEAELDKFAPDVVNNTRHKERDQAFHRAWLKKKIIRRKFFKKAPELNLLSWAAKEQIQHLHALDPSEWDVATLAESFPISEDGVRQVLKANYVRSEREVAKHDMRVRRNWTAVKLYLQNGNDNLAIEGGPLENTVKEMHAEGKLTKMLNAGGLVGVQMPDRTVEAENEKKHIGLFESIVKDVDTENQKVTWRNSRDMFIVNPNSNAILSEISQMAGSDDAGLEDAQTDRGDMQTMGRISYEKNEHKRNNNLTETLSFSESRSSQMKISSRRDRKLVHELQRGTLQHISLSNYEIEKLGMFDTGRVDEPHTGNSHTEVENSESGTETEENIAFSQQHEHLRKDERREVLSKMRYDTSGGSEEVAYLYDYRSGYHYPLGKPDHKLNKLDIPESLRKKGDLYQRDNYVYDDDGEFLYKIP